MNLRRSGAGAEPSDYVQAQLDRLLASASTPELPTPELPTPEPSLSEPLAPEPPARGTAVLDAPRRLLPERFRLERRHVPAMIVVVGLALALMLFSIMRAQSQTLPLAVSQATPPPASTPAGSPSSIPAATASSPEATRIQVHVTGAVKKPGVVRLKPGARVHDALTAAGGLGKGVKTGTLNLAQPVEDGQQVFVALGPKKASGVRSGAGGTGAGSGGRPPVSGAHPGAGTGTSGGSGANGGKDGDQSSRGSLVNLNTASATELEELPGVGPVMAGKIVAWRTTHTRFSTVSELQEIDGVGPKTYARLAPLVSV